MTNLADFRRGDTFVYSFTLGNTWVGADFTGGVFFTLRSTIPESSEVTDTNAVAQATDASEISFSGAVGTITIPASSTTAWPLGKLYWDVQGVVSGTPDTVYTIDAGEIQIRHDITRRTS